MSESKSEATLSWLLKVILALLGLVVVAIIAAFIIWLTSSASDPAPSSGSGTQVLSDPRLTNVANLIESGDLDAALAAANKINPTSLSTTEKTQLYGMLYNIYASQGNYESAEYYQNLLTGSDLPVETEGRG